ncbi:MAG TPA: bifunctional enoyl-CoA hydratase/phosphate acetyltransferase [Candidatus Limnocylindria bacterium]|nr:bifunctional enoyl-CoA hydratase/phosphate acetyltransferase [Candidatus Limnocylindria bacterium]
MRIASDGLPATIENRTFDELAIGDSATISRTLSADDLALADALRGEPGPAGLAAICGTALIDALLTTRLPGPGATLRRHDLHVVRPLHVGDTLVVTLTLRAKDAADQRAVFAAHGVDQRGAIVLEGTVEAQAPIERIVLLREEPPRIDIQRHQRWDALLESCRALPPLPTAVVFPCDRLSIAAAIDAAAAGLIAPLLIGPRDVIARAARDAGREIGDLPLLEAADPAGAAAAGVAEVVAGRSAALMKGALHTDVLLHAIVTEPALRTQRRISHCYLFDAPGRPEPFILTDCVVAIAPTLAEKADIVRNAIDLAHALGIATPRVAILSAVETVNPKIASTLDAAALAKMADRGQITGALVDGPFGFDNAISAEAAGIKHIASPVAGRADVLVVPDLEAGNMLAKDLEFLSHADAAGIVLGARVPVVLTSRADTLRMRLASCALAVRVTAAVRAAATSPRAT